MKKITGLIIVILAFVACKNETANNTDADSFSHDQKVYAQAIEYGDINTAIFALHNMLAHDTTQTNLNDSLARLYYSNGQYFESLYAAEKVLARQPDNPKMLEITAVTHQSMGRYDLSLQILRKLYAQDKKVSYLYNIAFAQLSMNQMEDAMITIDSVLSHPGAEQEEIDVLAGQGRQQPVKAKAAAYNLKGLALIQFAQELEESRNYLEQERVVREARDNFQKALEIEPEFVMAGTYLNELNKILGR